MPSITDLFNRQNATAGIDSFDDATARTFDSGTYYAVQFITDTVVQGLTITSSTTKTGTYPAGSVIYGDITAIQGTASDIYVLYKC